MRSLAPRERVDPVHLAYLVQPNKRDRPEKQERPAGPRSSRQSRVSCGALWRTVGCSLSADRSPPPLGIHEGSFEALSFFVELQTILLDLAIDFPP